MDRVRVCLLGAGFIADIHAESFRRFVPAAELIGVASRTRARAEAFADKHHIPQVHDDWRTAIANSDCDLVDICLPNHLHHAAVLAAAAAGKQIIIEKPLAMNLREADEMIDACDRAGVLLMYAEELCFAPKYERVRELVANGAVGMVYQLRQCEKHSGPHSEWFYDVEQSGGGVLMDMGCHGIAWFRWLLGGNPEVAAVQAHLRTGLRHGHRTTADENAVCLIEFRSGVIGILENSWAKPGGMDDRVEVQGTGGVIYADLFQGNAALTYSEQGYDYALEKAGSTQGWTFTVFEEAFNQGYPQELHHFVECVRTGSSPRVTGRDGRAVLEILMAAYHAAGTGQRVQLPFSSDAAKPHDLWQPPR